MPRTAWSDKRERQYEHIKDSLQSRGKSEGTAEEIAARTVNKERAQHGEAKTASAQTLRDTPAPVRGGKRSHQGAQGRTKAQLYEDARRQGVAGRSKMSKAELEKAVGR
jgi:plasmid stabilization system protein ParE